MPGRWEEWEDRLLLETTIDYATIAERTARSRDAVRMHVRELRKRGETVPVRRWRETTPVSAIAGNPDDPRHGTQHGYMNGGCRCPRCRAAHAEYYHLRKNRPRARCRCGRYVYAKGLCQAHYERQRTTGSPQFDKPLKKSTPFRKGRYRDAETGTAGQAGAEAGGETNG